MNRTRLFPPAGDYESQTAQQAWAEHDGDEPRDLANEAALRADAQQARAQDEEDGE